MTTRAVGFQIDLFDGGAPVEFEAPAGTPGATKAKRTAETLEDARSRVMRGLDDGVKCPCCGQRAKRYRRTIYKSLAMTLKTMAAAEVGDDGAFDVRAVKMRGGDPAKLRFWGLIEEVATGRWRVTDLGHGFLSGIVSVPRYVFLYDGMVTKKSDEEMTVLDALGQNFDREEIEHADT